MTAILYGNLRVEIVSDAGARVQRPDSTSPTNPSSHGSSRPIKTPGSTVTVLHLSPLHLSAATVGVADRQQITASGGARPYSFAVTSGTLPSGLTLSGGGLMSGTPTVAGSFHSRSW